MKAKLMWLGALAILAVLGFELFKKLQFGSEFYKVDNIHDLFEIFGAAATTVAVVVAAVSLGSWRKQAKASFDHELARVLIVNLNKFRDLTANSWSYAQDYIEWKQLPLTYWASTPQDGRKINVYEGFLKEIRQARAEIESTILEARVMWVDFCPLEIHDLYYVQSTCCFIIEQGIRDTMHGGPKKTDKTSVSYGEELWQELVQKSGMTDYLTAHESLDKYVGPIVAEASKKLIRS